MTTPDQFRWGIMSTGNIAHKFADAIANLDDAVVTAVGSRTQAKADSFGASMGIPARHGSYEALANDPSVDAVYISTPHPWHMENTLLCLEAGKHVLVEKPFAINAQQAQLMADKAREKGLFLMEAMWTRFLPVTVKIRELIASGLIGELRLFQSNFGFRVAWEPDGRLLNKALGGGALLDVGIYPVSYAAMLFGNEPSIVTGAAHIGETGVDEQFVATLQYAQGELAMLAGAVRTDTMCEAVIYGSTGRLYIEPEFFYSEKFYHAVEGNIIEHYHVPMNGFNGMEYQAMELMQGVRAGQTESEIMSLDDSVAIMRIMDQIRSTWGIVYPGD